MKKLKVFLLVLLLTLNLLISSSCWNYKEIEDIAIVAGIAVDYEEDTDSIIVTSEILYPSASGAEIKVLSRMITDKGENFFDAIRNTVSKSGMKLFWGHAKVIILSESLVKNKDELITIVDWFNRDPEPRHDIFLMISQDKSPSEILTSDIEAENITSFYIEDALLNESSVSKYRAITLWEFVTDLAEPGISPTLPTIKTIEESNRLSDEISGCGIFKDGVLVGYLNGIEARNHLMIINKLKGGLITEREIINNEPIMISLEIFDNKTKITPKYVDDKIVMSIDVSITVNIAEIGGEINFIDEKYRNILIKNTEKEIKNQLNGLITKVQQQYKSDIFGFGKLISEKKPKLWNQLKDNWPENFQDLNTEINVQVKVRGSAIRSKPITVGG
ncbi:Ger(x)C family spore germination protein [Sporosalibacterium faouarense]|uniref:Ger(x)C family spore germination protein n=1 Tax=Sporosalibacterium faouarense TaxID=516123 RepID=UPI00192AA724|nr:Ger(x)C family spore germination protein [Sporosalibacterium faouarense]